MPYPLTDHRDIDLQDGTFIRVYHDQPDQMYQCEHLREDNGALYYASNVRTYYFDDNVTDQHIINRIQRK